MAKLLDLFLCAQNTLETPELRQLFDQAAARVVQVEALHWCFFWGFQVEVGSVALGRVSSFDGAAPRRPQRKHEDPIVIGTRAATRRLQGG